MQGLRLDCALPVAQHVLTLKATLHRRFFASDFDGLARLRLEDFYFWPATSDLLTKPGARLGVAVAEDECARLHLADQF